MRKIYFLFAAAAAFMLPFYVEGGLFKNSGQNAKHAAKYAAQTGAEYDAVAASLTESNTAFGNAPSARNAYVEKAVSFEPAPAVSSPMQENAERVMRALAEAHPKRVKNLKFQNGDWTVTIRGEVFYYANGRLLPESMRAQYEEFDRPPFYNYALTLPQWKPPSEEESKRLRDAAQSRSSRTTKRSTFFFDALWNAHSRDEAWEQVKTLRFFGQEVLAHHAILEELAMVEQAVNKAALKDSDVKRWKDGIGSISSWSWRNIADVNARSNHAYGIAIDIEPKKSVQGSLATYWLWSANAGVEWWALPYSRRYHPPEAVVKIFESYGFIWGGKWAFFDTMHFEYRPEILLLSGAALSGEY